MKLNTNQLETIFLKLINRPSENEVIEFKEAKTTYDFTKLGRYFSALSNEANLNGQDYAWLLFGVEDKSKKVVGFQFRKNRKDLDSLKHEISEKTSSGITFIEIYELMIAGNRVLMLQIPAAPRGIPVSFEGHYYGRNGESLVALNAEEYDRIRAQHSIFDWSAVIVPDATLDDLDPEAIVKARANHKIKFPTKAAEADASDDITFLNKFAKLTIKGKITRAAILLLGREESEHFLNPANPKIRWVLKNLQNQEKDHDIIPIPFLLAVDQVYSRIRNLKYRYMKEGTLFPEEVLKYEPFVIREALNNAIAHQDYEKSAMINVVEIEDEQLIFLNYGTFIPGSVEKVIMDDAPEAYYRNPFLASAMFNLNMVDTAGGGIKKIFNFQRARFFSLPEYEIGEGKVKLTVTGKVLNLDFARVLASNPELNLNQIIILDKVQKKKPISDEEAKVLKRLNLIEGRKPNYYISSRLAVASSDDELKAQYIHQRGFDDDHYKHLIIEYLKTHTSANRKSIDSLLMAKLPDVLSPVQKKNKINNLLGALRRNGQILNQGSSKRPSYSLTSL